jgi:sulfite exporter TauE/SafE
MDSMHVTTGFILGLLGSLHCLGMCGPIALALPLNQTSKTSFIISRILYNFGRVISYSLMGFVFGLLGDRLKLIGLQQFISVSAGVIILIYALFPQKSEAILLSMPLMKKALGKINQLIAPLFKEKSVFALLKIGILNGFLPCGFVYVGIAGAISTGSPFNGLLFMFLFGLGTIPLMFTVTLFSSVLNLKVRLKLRKIVPVFVVIMALLFILRGLGLGIPYLSPKLNSSSSTNEIECVH